MFFFIGLTMATIQGAYARRISPGGEIAAVKRVRGLPWAWGQAAPRALRRQRGGPETSCVACRPSCCSSPAFLLIGWGHTLPVLGLGLLLYSFGEWPCPGWRGVRSGAGGRESWRVAPLSAPSPG